MEDLKVVNNWKAAEELERFKQRYLDPAKAKVDEARKILEDPLYKWRKDEKDRAKQKFAILDTKNIDYHRIYAATMELIAQHERQTDLLTEIYSLWFHNVSNKGKQPSEMMNMQADLLQSYFQRIFEAVEPLKLQLTPTSK